MIKLNRISISGFRGIPGCLDVDLSAPLTVLYAPNGVGKTSICDAAEWLLTNSIKRLEESGATSADYRCDFALPEVSTCVEGALEAYGESIDVKRSFQGCHWRRYGEEFAPVTNSEFLETIAPSAVEPDVHKTHANHSRQIWLRGTRFLSGDSLAALLESGADAAGNRERLFADMLGVGHLIETERQLDIYLKNLNQYVRQQQALIDNRTKSIQQRKASLDDEARENEKSLLPSAFAKASEAAELIQLTASSDGKPASSVSDARRVIAVVSGEIGRKKSTWAEKRAAEVALAADWASRYVLVEQQSADQERALAITQTLVEIDAEALSLREQLEAVEEEQKQLQHALDNDQVLISKLQSAFQEMSGPLSRFHTLPAENVTTYRDAVMLTEGAQNSAILESMLNTATRARAELQEIRSEAQELGILHASLAEIAKSAASVGEAQRLDNELTTAVAHASSLRHQYGRLAGPVEQLRQLSATVVDMLSHADHCPVCAHNWGSTEGLKEALGKARVTESPDILRLSAALESADSSVRRLQEALQEIEDTKRRASSLEGRIAALQERRRAFFDGIGTLGLKNVTNLDSVLDGLIIRLSFILSVRPVLALMENQELGLDESLLIENYVVEVQNELERRIAGLKDLIDRSRAKSRALESDLDRSTRRAAEATLEAAARRQRIENAESRIQSLRASWHILSPTLDWTNETLAEVSSQLLAENSQLSNASELIAQAERLMEASDNLAEIASLEAELLPIDAELARLTSYALAAEATQKAYQDMRREHVRRQMEDFVRVISALFTRMQSNEVYDRIVEGDESSPLSWRAIAEGYASDPALRFSQGQRQDFALAVFLARARGVGGTFFLDEPLVHLDDLNRVALLDVFRAICLENNRNISIVLTTASKPTLRHFIEKFSLVSASGASKQSLLRVVELEGSPRSGVALRN